MTGHVLISSLKNEGPFILEWVAHHKVIGFDAIHIASNDCTDGSDDLLAALAQAGVINHVPNPLKEGEIPQHAGYEKIRATCGIDGADWLMMLDTDEFLNIHIGANRVQDLTAMARGADVIRLSGRTFSDLPQTHWRPGPVTRAFPMALAPHHPANQSIKTLTRDPARFAGIHNHHMVGFRGKAALQIFCAQSGETKSLAKRTPLADTLRHIPNDEIGFGLAQYNHYAVKTLDSYMLRRQRGRGAVAQTGAENDRHTYDYFRRRSGKGSPEPSISRYFQETDELIAKLMENANIARAHHACVAAYAQAIADLHAQPDPDSSHV